VKVEAKAKAPSYNPADLAVFSGNGTL